MASAAAKLFFSVLPLNSPVPPISRIGTTLSLFLNKSDNFIFPRIANTHSYKTATRTTITANRKNQTNSKTKTKKKKKQNEKKVEVISSSSSPKTSSAESLLKLKRRTRSNTVFQLPENFQLNDETHIPVMITEVLEVFQGLSLHSFVDCTLGAAGHSSAIIRTHPELRLFVGLDVDPVAHEKAEAHLGDILNDGSGNGASDLKLVTRLKNFKDIKSVLTDIDEKCLIHGIDGILMDLGMSSMQLNNGERGFSVLSNGPLDMRMNPNASLKAEDILNSWPEAEVGRILRDYGEESNWRSLQSKIVKARLYGGLHSTSELVRLIRGSTPKSVGRQGWIKTATRVFQALRIAVNDELKTLEDAIYACFSCLSSRGRLAVISFHSLEDRIVKQTFLDIAKLQGDGNGVAQEGTIVRKENEDEAGEEERDTWIKQKIVGQNGIILTKRPITPCEEEESLNRRCRSAKLRVIQKV